MRSVKDDAEIAAITEAAKITDKAFEFILGFIKPGMSEDTVNAELKYFIHKKGLTESFSPIVVVRCEDIFAAWQAFGPRSYKKAIL